MKKNSIKKAVAAIAAAATMLSSVPALGASAASSVNYAPSYNYFSLETGLYYNLYSEAVEKSGGDASKVINTYNFYNYSSYYANPYYSSVTGLYYPTYAQALAASNGNSSAVYSFNVNTNVNSSTYTKKYKYYSKVTGLYYDSYAAALVASNNKAADVIIASGTAGTYYSSYTGKYYNSLDDALKASNFDVNYISVIGTANSNVTVYVYNGKAYSTLKDAIAAGGVEGKTITEYKYNYKNPSYYYDYFNNYNGYYNPYYYNYNYYYNYYNKNNIPSTAVKATENDGTPFLYGNAARGGWSFLSSYVSNSRRGTVTIDMNGATVVDGSILKAAANKNLDLEFVLGNGAVWTVNGKNIKSTDAVDIGVNYDSDYISSKLKKKAANGSVASAEIGISNGYEALGFTGTVSVKFSSKRAGCLAKIYYYDEATNSLKLDARTTVDKNGRVEFACSDGAPYYIVLF